MSLVLESLRLAQAHPEATLDVQRLLPREGKLNLPWLKGMDWVTATIALEIYERISCSDLVVLALMEEFEWRVWLDFEFRAAAYARVPVIAVGSSAISQSIAYYVTQAEADFESFKRAVAQVRSEKRAHWSRFYLDGEQTHSLHDVGTWNIREWAEMVRAQLGRSVDDL